MTPDEAAKRVHPQGEGETRPYGHEGVHFVDTPGGRWRTVFDDSLGVSATGACVGFAQFLHAGGRFARLCETAPFAYASNNAPEARDIVGALLLGVVGGANRFAHLNALRHDTLAMEMFGMSAAPSEDSVRRALRRLDRAAVDTWAGTELLDTARPFLRAAPWILDIDVTVKPVYGRAQEGAVVSYNPMRPGRPTRVHHTFLMAGTRLVLDADVRPGDEHASRHGLARLDSLLEKLPPEERPRIVRGDCAYGTQDWMRRMDELGQPYLFKVRLSKNVAKLARAEPAPGESGWKPDESGWECRETRLKCDSWERDRRVVVMRRKLTPEKAARAKKRIKAVKRAKKKELPLLAYAGLADAIDDAVSPEGGYEYAVLASNIAYGPVELCRLYRDRADAENPFDELKNQWGWGGFSVRDLDASACAAMLGAIFYNWWSLYARLVIPGRHSEAVTSRPKLLGGVARKTEHAGTRTLAVKLMHTASEATKAGVVAAFVLLASMCACPTARQSDHATKWARLGGRIAKQILDERALRDTPTVPMQPPEVSTA